VRDGRAGRAARGPARIVLVGVLLGLGVWLAPGARAGAQTLEPPLPRQGYYFGLGYHLALNKVEVDSQTYGAWLGSDISIRLGEMVTRRFGLGLQFHVGSAKGAGQTASLFGMEMEAQWEIHRNLAIHGGAGLDVLSATTDDDPKKTRHGTAGSGYFLGLDYSWFFTHRLTGGWAATPRLEARYIPGSSSSALVGMLGVEISYWTGLPRNQLDLPPSEAFKKE
jgi:hypothetical protein